MAAGVRVAVSGSGMTPASRAGPAAVLATEAQMLSDGEKKTSAPPLAGVAAGDGLSADDGRARRAARPRHIVCSRVAAPRCSAARARSSAAARILRSSAAFNCVRCRSMRSFAASMLRRSAAVSGRAGVGSVSPMRSSLETVARKAVKSIDGLLGGESKSIDGESKSIDGLARAG